MPHWQVTICEDWLVVCKAPTNDSPAKPESMNQIARDRRHRVESEEQE
jgi:hypothetical protein